MKKYFKNDLQGMKKAERFQLLLYNKYNIVEVKPWGFDGIVISGKNKKSVV